MSCSHETTIADESSGERCCIECGCVVANAEYITEIFADIPRITTGQQKYNKYNRPPKENYAILNQCCQALDINAEEKSKAKFYLKKLNEFSESWPSGATGKLKALSCIYFVIKHDKPLPLATIADLCNVDQHALLKAMWQYENDLKSFETPDTSFLNLTQPVHDAFITKPKCPSIFIEKGCSLLQPQPDGATRVKIVKRCNFLVEYAKANNFVEGRNPLGIAVSVIFFALETFSLDKYLTKIGKKKICEALSVKIATANERYKEIVESLVNRAKPFFPQEITKKNIASLFEELEPILQEEMSNQIPSEAPLPPCFVSSEKIRQERLTVLNRVKEKIKRTCQEHHITQDKLPTQSPLDAPISTGPNQNVDEPWTTEELKMEKLLLQGVSEDEILAGYIDQDASTIKLNRNIDLDSNEITDLDMPESEIRHYVIGKRKKKRSLKSNKRSKPN